MVIDYRKLNAMTILDGFPLSRQDEILKALTGSQCTVKARQGKFHPDNVLKEHFTPVPPDG